MPEPFTISIAAISAAVVAGAHFVLEHGVGHTVGGEIHHFYRHFVEIWRESRTNPDGLPYNHDLEEASKHSLRAALLLLAMELAGRMEPQKSWLSRWAEKIPGGADLFPSTKDPHRRWLNALRKAARGDRFQNLHRYLSLNEENLAKCFATKDVCKTLGPLLADAVLDWARYELPREDEPPGFESLVREGWLALQESKTNGNLPPISVGLANKGGHIEQHISQPITLAHAYCLFFREHLKRNPRVFRIVVTETLTQMRDTLNARGDDVADDIRSLRDELRSVNYRSLKVDFTDLEGWLDPQLGELKSIFAGVQVQIHALTAGQRALADSQGEILVAITTLAIEIRRGTSDANAYLERFLALATDTKAGVDTLVENAVATDKTLGNIQAGVELLVEASALPKPADPRPSKLVLWLVVGISTFVLLSLLLRNKSRDSVVERPFSPDDYGILVLRFAGTNNALRQAFIHEFRQAQSDTPPTIRFNIHGTTTNYVSELEGLEAHARARSFGEKMAAKLVVWGEEIQGTNLSLHITVVNRTKLAELGPGEVSELDLDKQSEGNFRSLVHFIFGYALYCRSDFSGARREFETALEIAHALGDHDATLRLMAGMSGVSEALRTNAEWRPLLLMKGTNYLSEAQKEFANWHGRDRKRGMAWNALGTAYSHWWTNRTEYQTNALFAYEQAIKHRAQFSEDKAQTLSDLGSLFLELVLGSRETRESNVLQAITYFTQSLELRPRTDYPVKWATTMNKLGHAHDKMYYLKSGHDILEASNHINLAVAAFSGVTNAFHKQVVFEEHLAASAYNGLAEAVSHYIWMRGGGAKFRAEQAESRIVYVQEADRRCKRAVTPELWAWIRAELIAAYQGRAELADELAIGDVKSRRENWEKFFAIVNNEWSSLLSEEFRWQRAEAASSLADAFENKPTDLSPLLSPGIPTNAISALEEGLSFLKDKNPQEAQETEERLRKLREKEAKAGFKVQ